MAAVKVMWHVLWIKREFPEFIQDLNPMDQLKSLIGPPSVQLQTHTNISYSQEQTLYIRCHRDCKLPLLQEKGMLFIKVLVFVDEFYGKL